MKLRLFCVLLSSLLPGLVAADQYETRLVDSVDTMLASSHNTDQAEYMLSSLLSDYPNSQAANLLLSDIFAARAGVLEPELRPQTSQSKAASRQLAGLRDEISLRWNQSTFPGPSALGLVPASIIQLAEDKESIVFVETAAARVYIFKNNDGKLLLLRNNYTTIGANGTHKRLEGDKRTPIGVYHVTKYIDGATLPPLYGAGAFPINYPNVIDKQHRRTGYGIWLHGTHPESFNRIPEASDGCVAMSNPEFELIRPIIKAENRTTVIIEDKARWVDPGELFVKRDRFEKLLNKWAEDWGSLDAAKHLSHYDSDKFFTEHQNYSDWANSRTSKNAKRTFIDINLSNISLFEYPGETDMVVAEFTQTYHSNDFNYDSTVRQYWQLDAKHQWKIIYEGLM